MRGYSTSGSPVSRYQTSSIESTSIGQGLLYKSRVRTEPTNVTAPQWTAALWGSLESLIEEMADCCIKVYTLEKVLKIKRDPVTEVVFLDEAMKVRESLLPLCGVLMIRIGLGE